MIIFIANQFIGKNIASGGDVLFIEILKRCREQSTVIAPLFVHRAVQSQSGRIELVSSDHQNHEFSASDPIGALKALWRYFGRAIKTYVWLRRYANSDSLIYLTGDFICNTLPVMFFCLTGGRSRKICLNFFHRNPSPRDRPNTFYLVSLGSRLLQSFSLFIIRRYADRVFTLSLVGCEELIREKFAKAKITVSGAGVNPEILSYRGIDKIKNRIIFIGRLNSTKGALDVVEISRMLADVGVDFECLLLGHGSDTDKYKITELIERYNLSTRVKVMGYVSEREKYRLLASSKVLVFPSKEEGYGIAVHEALMLNIQVVCFNLPALELIFGRCSGINFVDRWDLNGMMQKTKNILLEERAVSDYLSDSLNSGLQTWDDVYKIQAEYFYDNR